MVILSKLFNISVRGGSMRFFTYQGKGNISGDRIRELRQKARLSQSALAAQMQVRGVMIDQDAISRIERGARIVTDYELRTIAKLFDTSTDWIVGADK